MRILTLIRHKYFRGTLALAIGIVFALGAAQSPNPQTFRARLAPVAIDAAMKANVAGSGSLTAVLAGSKLTLNGKFDGLRGPATVARIHQGLATGVRGPAILELSVSKATSGSVSGSFDLAPDQVESLQKGKWYVQIHSEKAPEGNLWGWLLK
jgi:CHRD domain